VTLLFGRIWCGYGCPQTVFVEWVYRPIEEWIEGPANHRRAVDQKKLTPGTVGRKIAKHTCFLLVSAVLGNVFLGYFVAPKTIWEWMQSSPVEHPTAFLVMLAVTLVTYFDFAWFREQFCSFLCPYARLQSVFIAPETPTVAYDASRGEPRGKRSKTGDCIDCGLCVRVCPTGIDIRNGLQLECIQCSRCVDACDLVMTNLKRPTGLIRHASQATLQQNTAPKKTRIRPVVYALALILLVALLFIRLDTRPVLSIVAQRIPGTVALPGSQVANVFHLRLQNNSIKPTTLSLAAIDQGVPFTISCSVCGIAVPPFGATSGTVMISAAKASLPQDIQLTILPGENTLRLKLLP
jgi:cytochrome c oxidase accessory protein FixG